MERSLTAPRAAGRWTFALATAWALLVLFGAHALDFPGSLVDFTRASGGGVLLDLEPAFSEAEVYRRLAAYGEAGRENYAFRNRTVDVLLPLSLLPFLFLLMRSALRRLPVGRGVATLLLALPFVYVVFDLAENASVLVLLASFPEPAPATAAVLPYLTLVKRAGVLLAVSIPLSVFAISLLRAKLSSR